MIIDEAFHIAAYWKEDKITLNTYLDLSYEYLVFLSSKFKNYEIKIVDQQDHLISFEPDINEYKKKMKPIIFNSDAWYLDEEGNRYRDIELEYFCDAGFYSQYFFERDEDAIQINIRGGNHQVTSPKGHVYGNEIPNSVLIYFPQSYKSKNLDDVREVFLKTIGFWNPDNGILTSDEFLDQTYDEDDDFYVGWMNYFKNFKKGFVVPPAVNCEFINEGALLSLIDTIPNSVDQHLLQSGNQLREFLDNYDLLKWPTRE